MFPFKQVRLGLWAIYIFCPEIFSENDNIPQNTLAVILPKGGFDSG